MQDKEAASKAQQEAVLMETEVASLQKDKDRIDSALSDDAGVCACVAAHVCEHPSVSTNGITRASVGGSPPPTKLPPGPTTMSP